MLTCPKDLEFSGLIDDGLDAQNLSQLVVHLEPVVLHVVLDAGPRLALRAITGLHFAVETFVIFTPQVGEHLFGREGQQGEGQQPGEQTGQGMLADKTKIGGELGLIADPVMATQFLEFLGQERIDLASVFLQDFRPGQLDETVGQTLGGLGVAQLREAVVGLLEEDILLLHLAGQELMAIDINLTGERSPGLQTDMHQAEVGIEEVIIKDALRHSARHKNGAFIGIAKFERRTGFLDAQDADKTLLDVVLVALALGPGVLVDVALKIQIRSTELGRVILGMLHETLGPSVHGLLHEVAAPLLENVIDKPVQFLGARDGQMPLEDDPVEAR